MSATKKSISLPEELFKKAIERQKLFGYPTFSDYLQALIRADVHGAPSSHVNVPQSGYQIQNDQSMRVEERELPKKQRKAG